MDTRPVTIRELLLAAARAQPLDDGNARHLWGRIQAKRHPSRRPARQQHGTPTAKERKQR